jgi:hypothetical protein
MLKHLFPLFEYRSGATSGQSVLGWVTALSDIPIQGKMLIAAVGPRWCRHREEMIYTCTYSEMRILQLIVSGTLANAGRPERVINKTKHVFSLELRDRGQYGLMLPVDQIQPAVEQTWGGIEGMSWAIFKKY